MDESANKALGCVAFLALAVMSGVVETFFPLSKWQKGAGIGVLALVLVLLQLWMNLNDSDLAYSDRASKRRMARFRHRLREFFNIPVI